jgi:hypothetical protein
LYHETFNNNKNMEKLFDDTLLIQKERPTQITKQQEEQMFIDLAEEVIKNQYSFDYKKIIIDDLKELSINDSGFEKAKYLEENGMGSYEFDGDFIDWLDSMDYKKNSILTENVKLWVKAHNPQPKLQKGNKLKIIESISYSKYLKKDCIVYVTGLNYEQAYYTISEDKERKGGYVLAFEKVESSCELF